MAPSAVGMDVRDSILDTIGQTPIVRLSRIGAALTGQLVAKLEAFNPGGSIKDRVAVALIEAAEREGRLRPGGTIVEPTSGNTGMAKRRAPEGLSRDRSHARQDVAREDRPATRLRCRGRGAGPQRVAVYEVVKPDAANRLAGRRDF